MKHLLLSLLFLLPFTGFTQVDAGIDQITTVDFKTVHSNLTIEPSKKTVKGTMELVFDILRETDSVYIDAKNMEFDAVMLNGNPVEFYNDNKRLWVISSFAPSEENILSLKYVAKPKQTMYFINWETPSAKEVSRQVWTQGQGRYTSHWLPSFDDVREKTIFSLNISFHKDYEVIANGTLREKAVVNDSILQWKYAMSNPMSSYLVAVAAGKYEMNTLETASGIPVSLYYEPKDKYKFEPTYRYTKQIFDFLEAEIGVSYPWENYRQIPVQDFLYSGMENTETTIFANSFVVDSTGFHDRNYVNVNAHELAHQWFGNFVTAQSSRHHWLQEGFAAYYALLAEKEIFGEDYYYWKLYQSAEELKALSDSGKGEALLSPKASSLTYYQKGAWTLHILREKVGEVVFRDAVANYLLKNPFTHVTTNDFLAEVEKSLGRSLGDFKQEWLEQSAFQGTEALNSLKRSEFIRNYMEIAALREIPLNSKRELLNKALTKPVNDYIGQEAVYQLTGEPATDLYKKAFQSNNIYVRQAIATSIEKIPVALKPDFISLLQDQSYLTIENALLKLYMQFPAETALWLEKTKGIEGFSNKNVELLWLVLNLVFPVEPKEKIAEYFGQLASYTREHQPFELRQNAFGYLFQIDTFTDQNLVDLIKAVQHHNISFRDFSRKLLEELLQTQEYRQRFSAVKPGLEAKDAKFLETRSKE